MKKRDIYSFLEANTLPSSKCSANHFQYLWQIQYSSVVVLFPDISQRALTKASVFHMLRSNLNAKKSTITTASSAFLLLTICADNGKVLKFLCRT